MPSVQKNIALWENYDWSTLGEEWSLAWGGSEAQWRCSILPRIKHFLPAPVILEIGAGRGRWTRYLKDQCDRLMAIDLSESCIQFCQQRFAEAPSLSFHTNDGRSLAVVPDTSVDFVFSFDSLVHVEADVIQAYLNQLSRKLKPNGVGFIHHSNLGEYRFYYSLKHLIPKGKGHLWRLGVLDNDGLRGRNMTAKRFLRYAAAAGLQCINQEKVNWASKRLIDCFSVFTLPGSRWARPNVVVCNPEFMKEAETARLPAATKEIR
jgi:ubiquinone/menaquinone biosynthesis C-methylase UbiE